MSYHEFTSLPYMKQMSYVAFLVREERCLSLKTPHLMYAQAIAAVAAMMGCYCNIETVVPYSLGADKSYLVNLIPLVENSVLSQLVGSDLCPYYLPLAKGYKGETNYISEYSRSEEAAEALRLTGKKGSVLYADRIVSVEEGCPIPLLTMRNTSPLEDTK